MATMADIQGKNIKISKNTITIKDAEGKTRGLVRNATQFNNLPFRDQVDYNSRLRGIGAKGDLRRYVVICNKQLYFLKDTRRIENFEEFRDIWEQPTYKADVEHYNEYMNMLRKAETVGTVIECNILW